MRLLRELLRRKLALLGLVVIVLAVGVALAAPEVAPHDPTEQLFDGLTLEGAPLPPGGSYWLGTDLLGRDLLSRLIFGAQAANGMMPVNARTLVVFALLAAISFLAQARTRNLRRSGAFIR